MRLLYNDKLVHFGEHESFKRTCAIPITFAILMTQDEALFSDMMIPTQPVEISKPKLPFSPSFSAL